MEEINNTISKWTDHPPTNPGTASYCVKEIYMIAPTLFQLSNAEKPKLIRLCDNIFYTLCENYSSLCNRMKVETHGVSTPAMGLFLVCAILNIAGERKTRNAPSAAAEELGLSFGPLETFSDVINAVWLLNERWMTLRVESEADYETIEEHLLWLARISFYYSQTDFSEGELGKGVSEKLWIQTEKYYTASQAAIRRFVEGICRPMALMRALKKTEKIWLPRIETVLTKKLQTYFQRYGEELENVDAFRTELRDFLECCSVVGLDAAVFVEKEKMASYIPYLMLLMSRKPEFCSMRATFIECALLSKIVMITDNDKSGEFTFTERMAAVCVKLSAIHALLFPEGISFMGDYVVLEPFIVGEFASAVKEREPLIVMFLGEFHVLCDQTLYLCKMGATQAIQKWIDLVLTQFQGKLNGKYVKSVLQKLIEEESSEKKDRKSVV